MIPFAPTHSVSTSVLSLARGVLKTMFLNRLKTMSFAVLAAGLVSGAVWAHMPSGSPDEPSPTGALATTILNDREAPTAANSNASKTSANRSSVARPLKSTEDPPFECPMVMAANAVTRMMGYMHEPATAPDH